MAIVTGAITGLVGAGVGVAGLVKSGQNADKAQQGSLQALQMQIDERKRITDSARSQASLSPNEIKSINNLLATKGAALSASMSSIAKQQAELDAMDPNVKAAGAELYKTLTGEATKVLAPIEKRLQRQRQERMNQLQSQLGPGFMTSSAGIEAMNKFDTDSAMALNDVQQKYLSNITQSYLGLSGQQLQGQASVTNSIGNVFNQQAGIDQSVAGMYSHEQDRKMNAELGSPGASPVNFEGPANMFQKTSNDFTDNIIGMGGGLGKIAGNLVGQNLFANGTNNPSSVAPGNVPSTASNFTFQPGEQNLFSTGKL